MRHIITSDERGHRRAFPEPHEVYAIYVPSWVKDEVKANRDRVRELLTQFAASELIAREGKKV
jgi:hypothetical protein